MGWKFAVLDIIENLVYKNALRNTKIYHQFVSRDVNFLPKQNLKSVLEFSFGSEQIFI